MFGIGTTELFVILLVALIVLGPKKLPEIARSLGKGLAEFRRMSSDFQRSINLEIEREKFEQRAQEIERDLYKGSDSGVHIVPTTASASAITLVDQGSASIVSTPIAHESKSASTSASENSAV